MLFSKSNLGSRKLLSYSPRGPHPGIWASPLGPELSLRLDRAGEASGQGSIHPQIRWACKTRPEPQEAVLGALGSGLRGMGTPSGVSGVVGSFIFPGSDFQNLEAPPAVHGAAEELSDYWGPVLTWGAAKGSQAFCSRWCLDVRMESPLSGP